MRRPREALEQGFFPPVSRPPLLKKKVSDEIPFSSSLLFYRPIPPTRKGERQLLTLRKEGGRGPLEESYAVSLGSPWPRLPSPPGVLPSLSMKSTRVNLGSFARLRGSSFSQGKGGGISSLKKDKDRLWRASFALKIGVFLFSFDGTKAVPPAVFLRSKARLFFQGMILLPSGEGGTAPLSIWKTLFLFPLYR